MPEHSHSRTFWCIYYYSVQMFYFLLCFVYMVWSTLYSAQFYTMSFDTLIMFLFNTVVLSPQIRCFIPLYVAIYSALVCTKGFDTLIMFLFNPCKQFASDSSHLNVSLSPASVMLLIPSWEYFVNIFATSSLSTVTDKSVRKSWRICDKGIGNQAVSNVVEVWLRRQHWFLQLPWLHNEMSPT